MINEHRRWCPKIAKPKKITQVELVLNIEEIDDIVKCLCYIEDNVDLKTWDEKKDDNYKTWIWSLRSRMAELQYAIKQYNDKDIDDDDWRINYS